MSKFDCTILNPIEKPTFYRHIFNELVSTSTLDLVVVNENLTTKLSDFEVIEVSGVVGGETKQSYYHLPVSCTFSFEHKINRQKPSFHSSYLYEKADWSKLINEIEKNQLFTEEKLSFEFEDKTRKFSMKNLFINCYVLDENELPNRYKLKELSQIIPNFNEKVNSQELFLK